MMVCRAIYFFPKKQPMVQSTRSYGLKNGMRPIMIVVASCAHDSCAHDTRLRLIIDIVLSCAHDSCAHDLCAHGSYAHDYGVGLRLSITITKSTTGSRFLLGSAPCGLDARQKKDYKEIVCGAKTCMGLHSVPNPAPLFPKRSPTDSLY